MSRMADLPEPLARLAAEPSHITLWTLWKALPVEDRKRALTLALEQRSPTWLREYLAGDLVRKLRGYRLSTVQGWDASQLADRAIKHGVDKPAILRSALVALTLPDRRHLQAAFFDRLGIEHEDGMLEAVPRPAGSAEQLAAAASELVRAYPSRDTLVYLLSIRAVEPEAWRALDAWFISESRRTMQESGAPEAPAMEPGGEPSQVQEVPALTEAAEPEAAAQPARRVSVEPGASDLTILDDQITLTIGDAADGIGGALSHGQVDALVEELVRLNGRRHQSFYHRGFRDVMFGRPVAAEILAENESRRRWYFAGYIKGLQRRNRSAEITGLYDCYPVVRGLGRAGAGPCAVAAPLVFRALCDASRYPEAAEFVTWQAVHESLEIAGAVLDAGTALLRREEPALARPMFDVLWQGLSEREAEEAGVPEKMWSDVRRRRAHCLSSTDNHEAARPLLEDLLEDSDVDSRTAVLTDLALLHSGYGRLHELRFPTAPGDVAGVAATLRAQEARLREAMSLPSPAAGHGHYVWGFVCLLERKYEDATEHLERGLATFEARPEVYSGRNLLIRAKLHLAIAVCHRLTDPVEMSRAGRWIAEAIALGEHLPDYLLADTLDALAIADGHAATQAADQILGVAGERALDVLARSAVASRSRSIVDALFRRAEDASRGLVKRVEDYYLVLPLLLGQERFAEAAAALDALEAAAHEGIAADRFLDLLADPRCYQSAWELEDARWAAVLLHESRGEFVEAAPFLVQEFHRACSSDRYDSLHNAWQVLDRLEDYPQPARSQAGGLRERYDGLVGEPGGVVPEVPRKPVRVLVVGGNEVQARYDAAIEEELGADYPQLSVKFLHTGWTSNWGEQVQAFERLLRWADAVVFIRYMRTGFGRQARSLCGSKPWRGCGGRGKTAIVNSILAAAEAVRPGAAAA